VKEKVIILRVYKSRESDLLVHAINPQGGKVHFIARGGRASRRRFSGGVLEPTRYIMAHYRPGVSRDDEPPVHNLLEATLIKGFEGLRTHYDRLEVGLAMVGLISKLAQPGSEDSGELFNLLGNGLAAAETTTNPVLLLTQFSAKLLHCQGVLETGSIRRLVDVALKDHSLIEMDAQEINFLRQDVKNQLEGYLKGMTLLPAQSLEI
jgi:DNA repair protein RecO (recombination protein O)